MPNEEKITAQTESKEVVKEITAQTESKEVVNTKVDNYIVRVINSNDYPEIVTIHNDKVLLSPRDNQKECHINEITMPLPKGVRLVRL